MDICILNSGFGSRLKKYTEHTPKGLVPLLRTDTLLSRQVEILQSLGNHRYAVTTGYLNGMIQDYISNRFPNLDVEYFVNGNYASTNYITSMHLLGADFSDDIVILHGDLLFEKEVVYHMLHSDRSLVVVDSSLPLPEKDFKARIKDGKVIEIGISVFGDDCVACQPFYFLKKETWNRWQEAIEKFCNEGTTAVYAENALNTITDSIELYPYDIHGQLCMEIDDEKDLQNAKNLLENMI